MRKVSSHFDRFEEIIQLISKFRCIIVSVTSDGMGNRRIQKVRPLICGRHHDELTVLLAGELSTVRDQPGAADSQFAAFDESDDPSVQITPRIRDSRLSGGLL